MYALPRLFFLWCMAASFGAVFGTLASADVVTDRWNAIKGSGDAALITAFRSEFPGSPYDLDALVILAGLIAQTDTADAPLIGVVTFDTPLIGFGGALDSHSLAELLKSTPIVPPVEGLPDAYWKDKQCATCHDWTQATLCTQATHYTKPENAHRLNIEHPLGRPFKTALLAWAEGGCL